MGIHAVPLRRVAGDGGVRSMTSGRWWSARDLDPRIRKMAQEAARQAGMSLQDWIRAAVARHAGREEAADPSGSAVDAEALARLGDRVRSMSAQRPGGRNSAQEAELDEIVRRIAREFEDADESARSTVEGVGGDRDDAEDTFDDGARGAEARRGASGRGGAQSAEPGRPAYDFAAEILRGARRRAGHDARPPAHGKPGQADPLSAAIADIAHRQSFLIGHRPTARDESHAAIAALRADMAVLNDRVAILADRSLEDRASSDGAALRAEKAALSGQASMAAIEATLGDMRVVLDDLAASRASAADTGGMATLVIGLAELGARVEGIERTGRQNAESLRRLEARVENMARVDPVALVRGVETRIDRLTAQLEAAIRAPSRAETLDNVRSEIAAVRLELATRGARGMDAMEERIRDLVDQVAATSRSDDGSQLAALEKRIDGLAADLARALPRAGTLDQIEAHVGWLRESLAKGQADAVAAARAAARDAVQELGSEREQGMVSQLKKDLDEIRRLIAATGRADSPDDTAVEATVAAVAARIESIAGTEPQPVPGSVGGETATADWSGTPAGPALRRDIGLVREVAATAPAEDRKTAERRADFIAAARRAVQAAMDRAAGDGAAGEPAIVGVAGEPSPFARIGQAIRARRRPLLLAAAALVLAIGALQMFGRPMANAEAESAPSVIFVERSGSASEPVAAPAPDNVPIPAAAEAVAPRPRLVGPVDPFSTGATAPTPPPIAARVGTGEIRAAAAAGDPVAAYEIANLYADGRGTLRDLGQASAWYQRAADAGLVPAIYRLASLYERGQGVARDLRQAMALYQRAAEQGHPGAMYNLAVLLNAGAAAAPDPRAALHWFRAAAEHGVKDSQYNLGVIYSRGIGTPVDRLEAYKWFAVAAASGDQDAAAQRDRIAATLDPNDLSRARAATSVFRPKAPPPGAVDPAIAAPVMAADVASPAARDPGPAPAIAFESRQAMIRIAQQLLSERGFDPGPADGLEGPKTNQAVRAFQRSIGAASTGRIDESLVVRLSQRIG